jgi:3-dehydroquinate dehydratase/shikimate dehydrogenase
MEELAQTGYDILINSTPSPLPIARETILPTSLVMDINTKPKETLLLQMAKKKGCSVVYGYQMFTHQALGQFALWFNHKIEIEEGEKLLKTKASELLCEDMESYHSFLL